MQPIVIARWLLAQLALLGHSHAPGETPEAYRDRASGVTVAMTEEARPYGDGRGWGWTELAAAGMIVWEEESKMDLRIHEGTPHPVWTQDHGLSHCAMQLRPSALVPASEISKLVGTDPDATHACAHYGLRVLVAQARQCGVWYGVRANRDRVAMAFAAYATGGHCKPSERDWARADLWVKFMGARPDRSPLKGFQRAAPHEVPAPVRTAAEAVVAKLGKDPAVTPGYVEHPVVDGQKYALLVEKHAEGKLGVSVLVAVAE